MTVATDIAALKARCTAMEKRLTAVEAKNATQTQSILDLRARCTALETQGARVCVVSQVRQAVSVAR